MHEAGTEVQGQKIKSCPPHLLNCRGGAGIGLGACTQDECARDECVHVWTDRSGFKMVYFKVERHKIK